MHNQEQKREEDPVWKIFKTTSSGTEVTAKFEIAATTWPYEEPETPLAALINSCNISPLTMYS